jgi:hypothetical protein
MSRAQDVSPTVDLQIDTPTFTATASSTITPVPTPTNTATLELATTETHTAIPVLTLNAESPSPTLLPTLESSPSESTPETTFELPSTSSTLTPTNHLFTETAEATAIAPTFTLTASLYPTITLSPSSTETAEVLMLLMSGNAFYQNHGRDHAGIQISVFDVDEHLIGFTETDVHGQYALNVPALSSYRVVIEAALHRPIQFPLSGNEQISDIVLAGGDLDEDGCIGQLDLEGFISLFNSANISQGDITGDGVIGAADFAVLTGNYENNCALIEPAPSATPLPLSPTPSSTLIESAAPEVTASTPTEEPTVIGATLSPASTSTLDTESIITPSIESMTEGT